MALAPTALLLRPLPSLDQQPSIATVSTAFLTGSSSSHGSFSLFLHHRRPQSFMPAVSRTTPVEENLDEEEQSYPARPIKRSARNPPPWEEKNASAPVSDMGNAPWLKESQNVASVDASRPKVHNFRAAPWQQGSRDTRRSPTSSEEGPSDEYPPEDDATSVQHTNAEADKSEMAQIVEKLRRLQKGYHPADGQAAGKNARNGPAAKGGPRGSWLGARAIAHSGKIATEGSKKSIVTEHKGATTELSSLQFNSRAAGVLKTLTMQNETPVFNSESAEMSSKFPWERNEKAEKEEKVLQPRKRGPRVPTVAELTLPREELIRLRLLGIQLDERLCIGKLGVTKNIAISIRERFRSSELVKVRCEGPAAASIKKTALDLEEKTGGLVVLRTGKIIVMYRGSGYRPEERRVDEASQREVEDLKSRESRVDVQAETPLPDMTAQDELDSKIIGSQEDAKGLAESEMGRVPTTPTSIVFTDLYGKRESQAEAEAEAESILEGLGPRFENWTGLLPVPIDADLLPSEIPNYRPPFRLMPYGIKPRITDSELTNLRRLARPLAPHFVLGRNRGHQGLAAAMVKLWEKSEIAKVAVKRRVQNTNNLIMAEELKRLTGGILLSRDKFFITFYRGKDFVPEKVAAALVVRETSVRDLQELEEKARDERNIPVKWTPYTKPSISVIGEGAPAVKPSWTYTMDVKEQERVKKEVAKFQRLTLAHQLEKKLGIALKKKNKAEEEIKKLNVFLNPIDRPIDVETITEEERFMFQKLGLKMKAYLLIGRRGVFDGVVENMHLHWKHRELVKIVVKEADAMEVQDIARTLEYESGGILVSVSLSRKGQAIIMYRGKNYQRPLELRPRNLLTKRKALKKSLELQRHESLSKNIKAFQEQILSIQAELRKLGEVDSADDLVLSQGLDNGDQNLTSSKVQSGGLPSIEKDDIKSEDGKEAEITKVKDTGSTLSDVDNFKEKIKQLERLVRSGPLYRAEPLSNPERLELRKEALLSGRAPQFFVGKNNGLEGLARGLRIYFLHHDLVQIVVKGRGPEMLIEDVIHDLEELTGGVLVSREANKIIMYRGWPKGFSLPFAETLGNITPELLSALEAEEVWDDDSIRDYRTSGEAEESDDESELEEQVSTLVSDSGSEYEGGQMAVWEDIDEGSDEDSSWDDEAEDGGATEERANSPKDYWVLNTKGNEEDIDQDSSRDSWTQLNGSTKNREKDDNEFEKDDDEDDTNQEGSQDLSWSSRAQNDDSAEIEDEDEDEFEENDSDEEDSNWEGSGDEELDSPLSSVQFADGIFEEGTNQKLINEPVESW